MIQFLIRRILWAIPVLVGVSLVTFFVFYVASSPDEIARRNLSAKNPSQKQIQGWIHDHGYDKPRLEQFETYITNLATLNFGKSDRTKEVIWDRIRAGAGPSFALGSFTFIVEISIGLILAMVVAYLRGTYVDALTTVLCVVALSIPTLVYVFCIQLYFGKQLRLAPIAGFDSGWNMLRFLMLPACVGILSGAPGSIRLYRTFLLDEMSQDYARTARAKGVTENLVLFKHVLKNAMIPVITTTVASIPLLITGNIVTENFFGIPGLGNYLQNSITDQDFAVVRAMVFLGTLLYIIGLIVTDLLYAAFDPRVRLQ